MRENSPRSRSGQRRRRPATAAWLLHALLLAAVTDAGAQRHEPRDVARQPPLPVATRQTAVVRRALRLAETHHARTVDDWIRVARVPALPGAEAERARLVARLLREAGLATRVRDDGNVEAVLEGRTDAAPAVVAAHLDALHAPSEDHPVRRDGDLLRGPGVLDDGSGLAALVAAARILAEAGYRPDREVRFVATVGEEVGLVGSRSYLSDHPDVAAFISIDGILGAVDYGATGIAWLRYSFHGRGGHALLSPRTPSPAFAAGRAIASIASLAEATDAPLNVSGLDGRARPNAIPPVVSFTVDVRSDDPDELARLLRDIDRVCRAAAEREGVGHELEILQQLPAVRRPGHARSPLVAGAASILEWLGLPAATHPRGSSDHNVALLAGIPAIAVGATVGRHAHSPEEVADIELLLDGVKQATLLVVLLGEGLEPQGSAGR